MSASSNVTAGNVAAATDYNNLRTDVLNTSTGHRHDGTDSRTLATASPAAVGYAAATGSGPNGSLSDHVHALSITSYSDVLSGDVTMTNANQYYTVLSRSLATGTWLIQAQVEFSYTDSQAKLWNGSSGSYASASTTNATATPGNVSLVAIVTLGSTTTVYLSGACTAAGKKALAAMVSNSAGNTATQLVCIRIA